MTLNKKIINATEITYKSQKFKSKLEFKCYLLFKHTGIELKYQETKTTIFSDFKTNFTSFETKNNKLILSNNKIRSITYTPDFIYEDDNILIIIETKGYKNDVYPYKKKLYFDLLTKQIENKTITKKVYFFELASIESIHQSINIIKKLINNYEQ